MAKLSVVQENSSDAALRGVIADDLAPQRKKAVAREVLKRRRHNEREAWLARHGWVTALLAALAGLATIIVGKRRNRTS
jgi:hypothetical protein